MKGSEALLRAIASVGAGIPAVRLDDWMSQLLKAGFIKRETRNDEYVFHYELTEKAKIFLRKKGVDVK